MPISVIALAPMLLFQSAWTLKTNTQKTESSTRLDIKNRVILFSMADSPPKWPVVRQCASGMFFQKQINILYIISQLLSWFNKICPICSNLSQRVKFLTRMPGCPLRQRFLPPRRTAKETVCRISQQNSVYGGGTNAGSRKAAAKDRSP